MSINPSHDEPQEAEYAVAPGLPVVVRIFRERATAGRSTLAEAEQTQAPVVTRARRACDVAIAISVGLFAAGTLIELLSAITP